MRSRPSHTGFEQRVGPRLEPGQAFEHVVGPARLAVLAVVDDVDAGLDLPADDVGGGARRARRGSGALLCGVLARRLRPSSTQLRRPDQAADVRGEDAVVAALHRAVDVATLVAARSA